MALSSPVPRSDERTTRGTTVSASVPGLAALPPFLAQSILLSAVPADEQNKLTVDNVRFSKPFGALATVSTQWRMLAIEAASNVALCSLVVSVGACTRKALVELRRQLTLQRAFLVALDIQHIPHHGLIPTDQWAAVLACVPRLQEVTLDSLRNTRNAQLGAIVLAIGQQCRNLQSLVVSPAHQNNQENIAPVDFMRRMLSDPVYYTMEQVYMNTNREGLHRLCVCMRFDLQGLESTRKYMNHVLQFCPNLKRFDGYRAAVYALDSRLCYEQWVMDFSLWTRFCSTLGYLVEFDWICVPFATRFFEIFGQHPKPMMKVLTFTTAMNWKWDCVLRDVGSQVRDQLLETGLAGSAKNAHAALHACPNLRDLRVRWHNQPLPQPLPQPTPTFPVLTMMDPEIFGDAFWEDAVRLCPLLASITMARMNSTTPDLTVRSFTDRSLRALAELPSLKFFEAESVNVTGDGIFALAVHHAPSLENYRRFHLSLGDAQSDTTDERFYDVVVRFLHLLLAADAPLPCMVRSVSVCLDNKRRNPVDNDWSVTYLATLQSLIAQVQAKHAGVQLNAFAHDCDGTRFSNMSFFAFDSRKERTCQWMVPDDTLVAESIWNRVQRWDSEDDEEDNDEYYDDGDFSDDFYDGNSDYLHDDEYDDDYFEPEDFWGNDDEDDVELDDTW